MLTKIFFINLLCMIILISLGIILSYIFSPLSVNNQYDNLISDTPLENFKTIYKNNIFLLLNMLLGTITFGAYSYLLLCWNSFYLGTGIISLYQLIECNHFSLYFYIILEFTSLCLIATAAENLGINLFWYILKCRKPEGIRKTLILASCSLPLITLAGMLETYYMYIS